jgi:hypothetical protein
MRGGAPSDAVVRRQKFTAIERDRADRWVQADPGASAVALASPTRLT